MIVRPIWQRVTNDSDLPGRVCYGTAMASLPASEPRDQLTGLPDASAARETLSSWQSGSRSAADASFVPVHVMMLALGRFDTVNLAYGEATGDGALVEVASRIAHFARDEFAEDSWFAARIGGGKFLLAANEACSRERWQWLGEALADAVAHPIVASGGSDTLRLWPRIALMRALPGEDPDALFDRLATTLAKAQNQHGRRVLWVDRALAVAGHGSVALEADLLAALDRDEIEVLFQPQYSFTGDMLSGAEALARWQHPRLGRIGAGSLFAIAERADHVAQLSRHIVTRSLAAAAAWPGELRLSVNITPADLAVSGFAQEFGELVSGSGFRPDRLTLEITEQVLLADLERAAVEIAKLRANGIRFALDDFGAGFCNFRYLKVLPLDYLKLDRAMVEGIADDPHDLAVLRGIIAMAKALGLEVVAEGIEDLAQRDIAAAEGAAYYQGFFRAAPMGAAEFLELAGQ